MSGRKYRILLLPAAAALGYLALLAPESDGPIEEAVSRPAQSRPFAWKQDAFWRALESEFLESRRTGCDETEPRIEAAFSRGDRFLATLASRAAPFDDPLFRSLEELIFQMTPWIAACPKHLAGFSSLVMKIRLEAKRQSLGWDLADSGARVALYRLLYGGRAALEEALLQAPPQYSLPPLVMGIEEPSETPWASILGVKIHSGDILISRGGAATSALIARGNDFAGNFSHIALAHVDPKTSLASIIEAHIERGAAVSSLEDYLHDVKLRVMILRLRSDLPALKNDPLLPHRAAEKTLERVKQRRIPYDFAMDFADDGKWFCSEVASTAYRAYGVRLWMSLSYLSSRGLRSWLAGFGVRNFETQEPSDLEYDPQLQIVAEWRDLDALRKDHIDNAVTEVLLDGAVAGDPLRYDRWLLPAARLAKLYSMALNGVGRIGPVPEGMSATAALRNRWYTNRHAAIEAAVAEEATRFEIERGYAPPYWRLIEMAQRAKSRIE